jgi:sugar phosphate isomerase/epimerase
MISISTCWNSGRHVDGAGMIMELLDLGFERVELGHGIRVSLMHGIQKVFDKGLVQFSSLHNFCPLPVEITRASPDCLQFSSHRDDERERAVRQTFQTIDFAVRLGAPRVVLHCGRVPMQPITAQLSKMAGEGKHLSAEYARLKVAAVRKRESLAPLYLERLKECLKRVIDYAGTKGIRLGIEGRQAYEEIPTPREAVALLDELNAPEVVGYWHDFGHIQIQHNLGFVDHAEWLARISPRLLGCHLHDVVWPAVDHRAPFTGGSVDYERLIPLLPKGTLFVWEMSPRRKREEIIESLHRWKARFGDATDASVGASVGAV